MRHVTTDTSFFHTIPLSPCLWVCVYVYMSDSLSVSMCVYLSLYLTVSQSVCVSQSIVCLFVSFSLSHFLASYLLQTSSSLPLCLWYSLISFFTFLMREGGTLNSLNNCSLSYSILYVPSSLLKNQGWTILCITSGYVILSDEGNGKKMAGLVLPESL